MYKDSSSCKVAFEVEDSLGNVVFDELELENESYKMTFIMSGEYKFTFINGDVERSNE